MLVLVLLFCMITVTAPSASASVAGNNSGWFDLLDYSTVTDSGNTFLLPDQSHLLINMPFESQVYYVDMLLNIEGDCDWISVDVWVEGLHTLTWVSLGNGLHRVYGSLPAYLNDVFDFYVWHGGGSLRCTMLSLRLCTLKQEAFADVGTLTFAGQTVTQSAPNQVVQLTTNDAASFVADITISNWRKYDRIEVLVGCLTEHISSIFAYTDSYNLPVDVSYLDYTAGTLGMIYMVLSVDVSDIRDSANEVLGIKIRGFSDSSVRVVSLNSINGFVYVDPPSPLVYWFTSLFSKLGSWFDSVKNTVSTGFSNLANWLSSGFQSVVNKLDELVTGGSAGDKVSSGGNKIEQSSGSLSDNMDQIQDFENQQFGNLDAGMGTVIAGGDVSYLVAPLGFIHTYTNKIVAAIPSSYLVVFTLPMLFGVFMFIVGHPIRAPGPDTSGDQVTRETFTTTTVLDGKHKGSTTTTRTVTTSQEIGRRHTE